MKHIVILFFFSSRRRHTRSLCDWSSDVCSSDLMQRGSRLSPMTKRGNFSRSTTRTEYPARWIIEAATEPAGPAPITKTSTLSIILEWDHFFCFTNQQGMADAYVVCLPRDFHSGLLYAANEDF